MKVDGKEVNGTVVAEAYEVVDVNILTAALEFQVRLSGTRNTMFTVVASPFFIPRIGRDQKMCHDVFAQRSTPLRQNLKLTKKLTLTLKPKPKPKPKTKN